MQLSAIVPSIRPQNLLKLYNSLEKSFSGAFEFIVIGPYGLPEELKNKDNVRFIEDFGSPIRAQQIGLVNASGEYFTWLSDDGECLPDAIDISFNLLKGLDYMNLVVGRYREGDGNTDPMITDWYYRLKNHDDCKIKWIPEDAIMLNCGIVPTKLLLEVGGWDAVHFQCCPFSYNDLAIRLNRYGVNFIMQDSVMFKCSHMPGMEGDHGPIHLAQTKFDQPEFKRMYGTKESTERINIDINNWKLAPAKWSMRFGK